MNKCKIDFLNCKKVYYVQILIKNYILNLYKKNRVFICEIEIKIKISLFWFQAPVYEINCIKKKTIPSKGYIGYMSELGSNDILP